MSVPNFEDIILTLKKPKDIRTIQDIDILEDLLGQLDIMKKIRDDNQSTKLLRDLSYYLEHEYSQINTSVYEVDQASEKFYIILEGEIGIYSKNSEEQLDQFKMVEKARMKLRQSVTSRNLMNTVNKFNPLINFRNGMVLQKILFAGKFFGEQALFSNKPREQLARAFQVSHFAVLRKQNYLQVMKQNQEQKIYQELGFFAQLQIFENWNVHKIKWVYNHSKITPYRLDNVVFKQGEKANYIYCVKSGTFDFQYSFHQELNDSQKDNLHFLKQSDGSMMYQNELTKTTIKKIGTISSGAYIGLEDIMGESKSHKFGCVCSSSEGILICVGLDIFYNILSFHQSKLFIEEYCKAQQNFWDNRLKQVQTQINGYGRYIFRPSKNDYRFDTKSIFKNQAEAGLNLDNSQDLSKIPSTSYLNSTIDVVNYQNKLKNKMLKKQNSQSNQTSKEKLSRPKDLSHFAKNDKSFQGYFRLNQLNKMQNSLNALKNQPQPQLLFQGQPFTDRKTGYANRKQAQNYSYILSQDQQEFVKNLLNRGGPDIKRSISVFKDKETYRQTPPIEMHIMHRRAESLIERLKQRRIQFKSQN